MHWARIRTTGSPGPADPIRLIRYADDATCASLVCDRRPTQDGLCDGHAQRVRKGVPDPLATPVRVRREIGPICDVLGCGREANQRGWCDAHRGRVERFGDPLAHIPVRKYDKSGKGYVSKHGYRMISIGGGRARAEHRVLMEGLLRRQLLTGETVHHANGDRLDNATDGLLRVMPDGKLRSGNLELWSTKQPKGQAVTDKVAYAREILRLYGDLVPEAA